MSNIRSIIGEDSWKEVYYNKLIVDLINNLSEKDILLLKKFNIKVEDKVYTEAEYDGIKMILAQYYIEEDVDGNIVPPILELKDIGVTQEEYEGLLKTFDAIDERYGIYL